MRSGAHDARFFVLFLAGAAGPPQGDRLNFIPMQKAQRRIPSRTELPDAFCIGLLVLAMFRVVRFELAA